MYKKIHLGKIDYYKTGVKDCNCYVDIYLENTESGLQFTANGGILQNGNPIVQGQCLDTIREFITDNPMFEQVYWLWRLYHLNTMKGSCVHQRELGWDELALKPCKVNVYYLTNEGECPGFLQNKIIRVGELPDNLSPYYKKYSNICKPAGYLYSYEHPDGIFYKPCPVCGYQYGSGWNYMKIPENDLEIMRSLFD